MKRNSPSPELKQEQSSSRKTQAGIRCMSGWFGHLPMHASAGRVCVRRRMECTISSVQYDSTLLVVYCNCIIYIILIHVIMYSTTLLYSTSLASYPTLLLYCTACLSFDISTGRIVVHYLLPTSTTLPSSSSSSLAAPPSYLASSLWYGFVSLVFSFNLLQQNQQKSCPSPKSKLSKCPSMYVNLKMEASSISVLCLCICNLHL